MHQIRLEHVVINSRFIATLAPVFTVEEARAFIQRIRSEFADASHNVPAYIVGFGDSRIEHCSDAGEPSGTAGRPALAVLAGSGLGDVAVVITRYFGGTKLGTGGLVRAYTESARMVVNAVPRAMRIPTHTVMVEFEYPYLERIRRIIAAHNGQILDEDFTATVMLTARFVLEDLPVFQLELSELTRGALQAQIIETGEVLMPVSAPKTVS